MGFLECTMNDNFYILRNRILIFLCEHRKQSFTRNQLFYAAHINEMDDRESFNKVLSELKGLNIIIGGQKIQIDKDIYFGRVTNRNREKYIYIKKHRYLLTGQESKDTCTGDLVLTKIISYHLFEAEILFLLERTQALIQGNIDTVTGYFIPFERNKYPVRIDVGRKFDTHVTCRARLNKYAFKRT